MELKIFRTNKQDLVVKERSKPGVSYFVRAPSNLFSTPPLKVYRGPSEWSPQVATLVKQRRWPLRFAVTLEQSLETIVIRQRRLWDSQKLFMFAGKIYAWHDDTDLIDLQNDHIIANIRMAGSFDYGLVLTIYREGEEMMDIIVFTAIAVSLHRPIVRVVGSQIAGAGVGFALI